MTLFLQNKNSLVRSVTVWLKTLRSSDFAKTAKPNIFLLIYVLLKNHP